MVWTPFWSFERLFIHSIVMFNSNLILHHEGSFPYVFLQQLVWDVIHNITFATMLNDASICRVKHLNEGRSS